MSDNIDTRVSISLDPESLRLADGYTDETAQFAKAIGADARAAANVQRANEQALAALKIEPTA